MVKPSHFVRGENETFSSQKKSKKKGSQGKKFGTSPKIKDNKTNGRPCIPNKSSCFKPLWTAKTGKHVKGFLLLPEEVRSQHQGVQKRLRNLKSNINSSSKVEYGTKIASESVEIFTDITEKITQVSSLIKGIAESSEHQTESIDHINKGLEQIDSITQANASFAQETADASSVLFKQSDLLLDELSSFTIKDRGNSKKNNGSKLYLT